MRKDLFEIMRAVADKAKTFPLDPHIVEMAVRKPWCTVCDFHHDYGTRCLGGK